MTQSTTGVPRGSRRAPAIVITAAELPYEEQLAARKKRYLIMMCLRVPFLIAATVSYHLWWLSLFFIVVSIPLPWVAVLIANDRPARKNRVAAGGTINHERALPSGSHEIVSGD